MTWGMSFEEWIRNLLKLGKKSDAEEFKILFNFFGEQRVREIAKRILKEEKKETRQSGET